MNKEINSPWNETLARDLAKQEGLVLNDDHWYVLNFIREFYATYQMVPAVRIIVKKLAEHSGAEKGTSVYLQQLFPGGVLRQAAKIAGLPKPAQCV